jgi:hypothetical protein
MVLDELQVRIAVGPKRHKGLLQLNDSLGDLLAQQRLGRKLGAQELPQINLPVSV